MSFPIGKENMFKLYLNSRLWKVDLESDLLPHEDIGISRLLEERLQDVQLLPGERCPLSPLFLSAICEEIGNKYFAQKNSQISYMERRSSWWRGASGPVNPWRGCPAPGWTCGRACWPSRRASGCCTCWSASRSSV